VCVRVLKKKGKTGIAGRMLEWVLTVSSFVENLPEDSSTAQCLSQLYQLWYRNTCTVKCVSRTLRSTEVSHSAESAYSSPFESSASCMLVD